MRYQKLGNTDIDVSVIALGMGTWRRQCLDGQRFYGRGYQKSAGHLSGIWRKLY